MHLSVFFALLTSATLSKHEESDRTVTISEVDPSTIKIRFNEIFDYVRNLEPTNPIISIGIGNEKVSRKLMNSETYHYFELIKQHTADIQYCANTNVKPKYKITDEFLQIELPKNASEIFFNGILIIFYLSNDTHSVIFINEVYDGTTVTYEVSKVVNEVENCRKPSFLNSARQKCSVQ